MDDDYQLVGGVCAVVSSSQRKGLDSLQKL